ncbi:MAG TPA: sigma-54 dependent transcriptional regulator [Gammaproteobacteria bacterium]|nr:sigma-54 dependent transcriptional regulator [Gammaproteobacteria bacterium]
MGAEKVLIVDDEPDICELLEITLSRMGLETRAAQSIAQAHKLLAEHSFNLCLTDMRLPDGNGLDLIDYIQKSNPGMPVAVITAHGNMEAAIRAMKSGAFDFVSKPIDLKNLRQLVGSALKLKPGAEAPKTLQLQLLGESQPILELKNTIVKLARSQAPVYIHGESGTGKELVARLIHTQSARNDRPFVPVNCSAIPAELMESEFFGHLKGSFTGAHADKQGLFAAADGGTLFLDEVAELPIAMQVKLLRAIQERSIRPVGSAAEAPVNVRILSATHKPLEQLVAKGEFRQDLYYRINVIQLNVPSLRERPGDIAMLCGHILARIAEKHGMERKELSAEAASALKRYDFPGNVRELENILERAATLSEDRVIGADELDIAPVTGSHAISGPAASPASGQGAGSESGLDGMLLEQERESIKKALEQTRWNKTRAAELLGISFRQLRYRIKKLGIE